MPVAVIANQTPYVRQGQDLFVAGENFTGGTLRYHKYLDTTTTDTDKKNVIKDAIDSPPSVSWAGTGTNITTTVLSDNLIRVQTPSIEGGSNSWVAPFIIRNSSGDSATGVLNKPVLYGISGTDPARVYAGDILTIVGTCLASPNKDTTVWLWDGVEPVNTSGLYRCTVLDQRGASNTGSQDQCALASAIDFEIPDPAPTAGNYYVLVFTGENEWGLTVKDALQVTLVSGADPWSNPTYDDALLTEAPFTDITEALMARLFADDGLASATAPYVLRLPPGTFYLSHVIPWPANMGLQGSGEKSTILTPNPALSGAANSAGGFYYNLATYSTDHASVYGGSVAGIYSGDQRIVTMPAMIRVRGSNTQFSDLTLQAAPDGKRETVQACIGAADGINTAHFTNVVFDNPLIADNTAICGVRRFGRWRYWRFTRCSFDANRSMTAESSISSAFSSNGALDNTVFESCHFTGPNGVRANSRGINFGRCCVLRNLHFEGLRRCIVVNGSYYPLESAIVDCQFDHTGTERGQSEVIVSEGMECEYLAVASATASTFVVTSDSTNRTRWIAYVVSGKGRYQYRVIASSSAGTHTLESNWAITPDSTSVICCFPAMANCAIVGGEFQDTVGGINLYGMALGVQMRQNRMVSSSEGIMIYGYDVVEGKSANGWHSLTHNAFYQGSGIVMIAIRSAAQAASNDWPLIECVSATRTSCHGGMQCEVAAGIGDSATSTIDWTAAELDSAPLIDGFSSKVDDYYATNTKYLHPVRTCVPLPTAPWILSSKGITNFNLETIDVNDTTLADPNALVYRSDQLPTSRTSLTDFLRRGGIIRGILS